MLHWDAEEKGLLGSKHWAANPTIPINRVVAGLNLDMVGRLRDNHLIMIGSRSGYGWRRLLSSQNDAAFKIDFPWELKANADHYSLFEHEIPVLLFHTGMHRNYHRSSDLAKFINTQGMREVTRMLFGVVYELANGRRRRRFVRPRGRIRRKPKRRFSTRSRNRPIGSGSVGSKMPRFPAESWCRRLQRARRRIGPDFAPAIASCGSTAGRFVATTISSAQSAGRQPRLAYGEAFGQREAARRLTATLAGSPLRWGMMWRVDDAEPGAVILTYVVTGSSAARPALAAGDRIYQVAGRDFADEAAFVRLTRTCRRIPLPLLVERNGPPPPPRNASISPSRTAQRAA